MTTVIGVRFRHAGRIYYFSPGPFRIEKGEYVIVETARGVEYGLVVTNPRLASDEDIVAPLRSVIRKATEEDKEVYKKNLESEKEAFDICLGKNLVGTYSADTVNIGKADFYTFLSW